MGRCKKCKILFKPCSNNSKYCKNCGKYERINIKTIICCDCGKEFEVDSKDTKSTMCKECYCIYRKKIINENSKKYYYNKQNK